MHRIHRPLAIVALALGLLLSGAMRAEAGPPATAKVGFVDLQRTLQETRIGKKARAKLEGDKAKKQKDLDKSTQALEKSAAELNKKRSVLQPKIVRQREAEIQKEYVALQEKYMKLQQELAQMEAKLVSDIFAKAAPVIDTIAKRDGYTIILEKSESAVLWALPSIDITDEVNKGLDKAK